MHRQCGEHRTGVSPTTLRQEGASWLAVPLCRVATPSTSPRFPSQDKGCFAPLAASYRLSPPRPRPDPKTCLAKITSSPCPFRWSPASS